MEKVVTKATTFSYHKYLACLTKLLKMSYINRVSKLNRMRLLEDLVFETNFRTDNRLEHQNSGSQRILTKSAFLRLIISL
jgi:hypothetical protein